MSVKDKVTKFIEDRKADIENCQTGFYRLSIPMKEIADGNADKEVIGATIMETLKALVPSKLVMTACRGLLIYFPYKNEDARCFQIFLKANWVDSE